MKQDGEKKLLALLKFIGLNLNVIAEMRSDFIKNGNQPTKLLIPKYKLFELELEFADVEKVVVK